MYRYRYINKHFQFGQTNYSLILEDLEGTMPLIRIEKVFNLSPDLIDNDFLAVQANIEIINANKAYIDAQNMIQLDDNSTEDQGNE